ncbi:GNAT family N-acetyltransferase [Dactylosporangium sp. CA-139066]|uniref:GNAT family N-acetyltransferase n=1 Tax=Dactylosporangium sp. CA-139066 TaxID=3239930 RepID=UPI003D8C4293
MSATTLDIEQCTAGDLARHRDELLDVYVDAYADKLNSPFFTPERYWERVEAYAARDGYALVLGRVAGQLIGYAMGFTLPTNSAWWKGLTTTVDPALTTEDGRRTFALTYIMVRVAYRRRGYARLLHDALLEGRPEQRATLLVLPENVAARTAYRTWDWYQIGELQPFPDAPLYDALVLDLPSSSARTDDRTL